MRKMLIIPAVMLAAAFGAVAEERTLEHPGDGRIQYYKGYYWTQDEAGDSIQQGDDHMRRHNDL